MRGWFLVLIAMLILILGSLELLASLSASLETSPGGAAAVPWK